VLNRVLSLAPLVVGLVFTVAACTPGAGGTAAPSGSSAAPASGAPATPAEIPTAAPGATATPGTSAEPANQLSGTSWKLTAIGDQPIAGGVEATMAFGGDGQATGSGGCNTFNGPYAVDGMSIKIGPLAATMMACPEPQMTVEASYFAALDKVTTWQVPQDVPITQGPLVLAGPGGQPKLTFAPAAPAAAGLAGTSWVLAGINGLPLPAAVQVTAEFGADGTVSGKAGCNTYSGSYTVDGASITFGPIISTKMACPDAQMAVETAYLAALGKAAAWSIGTDGRLSISGLDGKVALVFDPAASLAGTSWMLTQQDGQPVSSGVTITAGFGADGNVSGSGGCNNYNGAYTVEGGSITFGPLASTMMACPEPQMGAETAYLGALEKVNTWMVEGTTLTLGGPGGQPELVFTRSLAGTTWSLAGLNGLPLPEKVQVTAEFGSDGTVSGSAGCNTYSGSYTLDGGSITIGSLASTEMACPEPQMAAETAYLAALGKATAWTIDAEGKLSLAGADAKPSLVFTSAPPAQ
jgi:heat shock protein HslJ